MRGGGRGVGRGGAPPQPANGVGRPHACESPFAPQAIGKGRAHAPWPPVPHPNGGGGLPAPMPYVGCCGGAPPRLLLPPAMGGGKGVNGVSMGGERGGNGHAVGGDRGGKGRKGGRVGARGSGRKTLTGCAAYVS